MFSKRNIKLREEKNRDEKQRFSIRKLTIGATSVLVGVSFFMYGAQSASAATTDDAPVVEKSATEPSKEDGNEVGESNNDSKNNTEINMENSNGSGEAQRDVTPGTQSEKTEISKKAKNSVETTDKATKNVDNQSPTQPSSTDNTVKTEKDNSESKRDSSLETGNKAASQNVIESHDKQTSPSVKTADEPKIVDNTHESTNVTTAENSKATQTENAPAVNNTTSTEIQNNARDIGSQKNTNSSTLASQDANSKINQKNANSDTIELKVPTANKKVEMSEDIDAKTVALNLKDTKHELTNNMNTVESEKIATSSVKNRAMLLTSLIAEDPNTVTVSDAKGFINAIQNGTATTINVAKDLNLASEYDGNYRQRVISHKRDILIQSATPGVKHTIDFSGNSFSMNTQNSVTFKDLDLYERSYWGIVYNAGGYVFDNVNFAGSQLIYTESSINSTLTFKNNVTATAVGSYTGPIDGESRPSQGGNTQQILQFVGGTNHIIFDENSNVTLGTTNSNVLEIDGGTTTIDVKNGANVTINPHSKGNPENRNSIGTGSIARAIASNANTTINVDKGANLTINTEKASGDSDVAGALYLNSDAKFNVNGNLNINSNGTPSTKNNGYPVYIAGNAAINVGNGGKFNLSATNTGSYSDNLMSISGKGTVKLAPHSNFKISADGTGALTAINLSSGSTFTSDQPDAFTIDLSQNTSTGKSLIRNGTINFSRVKTMATDGTTSEPLGKIDVTYDRNGNATTYTITSLNEDTVKQVGEGLANKNLIDFVKAGEDVTLSNLHLSKDNVLTGTVASSGSDNPIYVTVTVGGVSTNIPVVGNYTVYTNTKGTVTSNNVDYAAQTASAGGNFSIDLSKLASSLTNDAQVAVTATKDFVEAAQTKSVAALRALNIATLQELVDAAPEEEAKPSYYNATEEAQKAYTDAISTGKTILADQNNYDQVDVDAAVTAIQNAQKALTGKETNKTELQAAIDQASTVESSDNYTNADSNLQKAYTDAISAGQTVLNKENVTQSEVDNALTTINNAKAALNGDAKKAASKEALQKAVDEAPTVKSDDAAYYNGSDEAKAAYDKAISAGQTVLADPDATATQITDTLNAINTAKSNLKGKATDKAALQTAVDNSATVKESNNYTNADQTQKSAYDNAVTAAQTVLDKTNATQAEVNQALQDLETANNNLNGDAKTEAANKAALEAAVKDAPNVRNTPAYYNGSEEAQTAYNSAINAGQAVLDQANPSANDVKTALDKINAARANLKGVATNTEALEKALTNANDAKKTGNYTNADQANQEALNNAITAGQEILKNTNATQAQIDSAAKAITDAISGLNGDTNLTNAKNAATEDIQKALDTKTTEITDATNIDQATKDQLIADAKKAAEDANTAINQATNADAVNTAKTEGITNINNVTVPSLDDAKTNAAKKIDQALTNKTKEINNAENIDQTTKDQLIKEATDAANTAKDAIEKATTNDEATKAGQAGVDAINNVKVPSVTDSQNAAKEAIDNALNAKTKEINDANNIDQTTKDQLIKEATDAANNAKEAIDKATAADAIKTARDEGTTNINNVTVPSLEDAKKAANKAVDDALTAQTEVINKADNLSDTEKKDLIDQATAEANKAKENIETATTNNEAAQAGQAGVDAIKKIVPTSLDPVKSNANKAIDDALNKKLEEINSANNLTTDEKTALTQEANTAADKAKEEIANATTNDAVIEAQNNGVSAIDGIKVPTESAVKEAAKKAVADAATAKNQAIDASNLTDEEKAALKQKVTDAQNAADQAIDNATTNAAVTEAQTNGIKAINGIELTTSTVKEVAKKAVADAATAKNNAIDASNLTDEEKAALKQKVTEAQNAADQAIDNATTNAAVTEAQTNGVNAINGIEVPTTSATKEQAITDLNAAVDDAKKAIDQDSNLTDEEKQAAKDQIDTDATKAQEAINNAKTNDDVKKAGDSGTLAIDKDVANAAIDNAVAGKKAEISKTPLTDEEKTALNNEVDQKAQEAKEAINNATTPEAVTTAQDSGVNNINETSVPSESAAKQAAKEAVAKAVDEKNAAIDSSNLTEEEKAALKQKVTEAQTAADQAIDNATTNAAVTEAQTNGVNAINGIEVPNKSDAKEQAITDLNTAVDNAKKAIDQDSNLTDEEKQAAKDQIDSDAKNAQDAINNAKTNDDVKKAADDGTLAIDKDVANAAIDNAVAGKKAEISNSPLTDEEKNALNNEVNQKGNTAKEAINTATTPEAVSTAQESGVKNINDTSVPAESAAKQAAKEAVTKAADEKNAAIDASNLTDEEKAALKQKVTDAQTAADQAIDNASTNAAVTEAQNKGVSAIGGIEVPTTSANKEKAITDLNNEVENAKKAIDQDSNLTDEEKQAVKDQIDSDAKIAQDAINNAKTDNDVNDAVNNGKVSIDKDVANAAIDNAVAGKKAEISNSPLTDEEKTALNNEVDQKAQAAKEALNNAITPEAVTTAQENGIKNITDTEVPTASTAKEAAKKAVAEAAEAKNNAIDSSNLTAEEKAALKQEVTDAQSAADQAIDNATTNAGVTEAQENGIKAIDNVTVPAESATKEAAKKAVAEAADAKNNAIDSSNLTAEEKAALKQEVAEAQNAANTAIDNATTNAEVTEAEDNGIKAINSIEVPTKSDAKEQATTDLNTAVDEAKKAIDQDSNLTDEEKQAAKDRIDSDAKKAQEAIDTAKTNDDVKSAIDDGTLAIDKDVANAAINNAVAGKKEEISKSSLTDEEKTALSNEVDEKANTAKDAINNATTPEDVTTAQEDGIKNINNTEVPTESAAKEAAKKAVAEAADAKNNAIDSSNLTDEEKSALKQEVTEAQNAANTAIDNATTNAEVTEAQDNSVKTINGIEVPTKSTTKEQATTDLNNEVEDAKKAVDQDNNLTDEQKQAAKDQIDSDAKKAQDAINNAKTNDDVKKAVDDGKLVIDKDVANAAIDNAVAGKKDAISKSPLTDEEKTALNNEVDQKAQDAKEAINNATTPEAVSSAQDTGIKNINGTEVPSVSPAKTAAKEAVQKAATDKITAINNASSLTKEEKSKLVDQVNNIVTQADANIDKATTNAVVEEAQENGISDINNIEIPTTSSSKDQAANTIDQAADEAKKVIDATPGLTDDQKQAAKDQIDQDAENTKNNIAKATDDQGVQDATDAGLLDIDKVTAKTAVDSAAAIKKDEISKAPLTTDEANNLNDLVDAEAQAAKDAIDGATTIPAVEDAKNTGVDTINNIQVPTTSPAKANANQAIDNALANKTQEINDASNLSDKQKQDLIDKATQEAEKAKDNIQNATSDEAVNQATDNGVEAIANITVPSLDNAKQDATQLIDDVLKQKEDEINNATHLTDEEKNDLIKQAEDAANEAKDKINQSTTNDDVAKERDTGIEKITNIKVPSLDDAKKNASKAIDDALEDKTKEINDQSNLSDKEKNNLIDQVTEIANKAKDKINHDVTNAEIAKDEKEGIDEIVNTKVPGLDDHKRNAIDSLDEAKTTKLTQISNATNLTAKEKNQLTQQVNIEYTKALDNINKATTNSEADQASANGVEAILNIEIPSLSEKKQNSVDALNEVREAKKEEINSATNLSQDEKDKLTKQVDQIADNAINAINGAKDDQAVKDAEDKGIHDILDVKIPSLDEVKNNAKQAIADALESKTKQINAATNLDPTTKQDLINQANDIAEKANKNIDKATSNDAVLKAADEGVNEINSIEVLNKVISKKDTSQNSNNGNQVEKTHSRSHANRKRATKETKSTSLNAQNPKSDSNLNKIAKNKKVLPQTGSKQNEGLVALGLLAAGIAGLISVLGSHKKKD